MLDGKFALTISINPIIIAPVFSVKQQHSVGIIAILAGEITDSYLRTIVDGNILVLKHFTQIKYSGS